MLKATQPHIVEFIDKLAAKKRYSHAYIFEGFSLDQKKEAAKYLAKSLNCLNYLKHPCNECKECRGINQNFSVNLQFFPGYDSSSIKIEDVKNIKEDYLYSFSKKVRVIFIENAQSFTLGAANSMLKFIEEPVDGLIVVLDVVHRFQLLPTILSRCQIFSFSGSKNYQLDFLDPAVLANFENIVAYEKTTGMLEIINDIDKLKLTSVNAQELVGYLMNKVYDKIIKVVENESDNDSYNLEIFELLKQYNNKFKRPVNVKNTLIALFMEIINARREA